MIATHPPFRVLLSCSHLQQHRWVVFIWMLMDCPASPSTRLTAWIAQQNQPSCFGSILPLNQFNRHIHRTVTISRRVLFKSLWQAVSVSCHNPFRDDSDTTALDGSGVHSMPAILTPRWLDKWKAHPLLDMMLGEGTKPTFLFWRLDSGELGCCG